MSDDRIKAFIREMHEHKIGVFAYFNVTEYGGTGGESGNTEEANRILREQFADALMKDDKGQPIPTWEGAMAMNARRDGSLFPALAEQLRRHIKRLPELDGFTIDRLDWGSKIDFGHDDGVTMIGDRPVQNMAGPVAEGVAEVCRQAHAAGWRVYTNHAWRIEVLRDNDGYCYESDHVRGLHYYFGAAARIGMESPEAVQGRPVAVRGAVETALAIRRVSAHDRPPVSHLATEFQCQRGRPAGTVLATLFCARRQGAGAAAALC